MRLTVLPLLFAISLAGCFKDLNVGNQSSSTSTSGGTSGGTTGASSTDAGTSVETDAGPFADLSADNWCERYAAAVCDATARCQGSALTRDECVALFEQSGECRRDLFVAGQVGLDTPKATACLEALGGGCDGASLFHTQSACNGLKAVPLVPVGQACLADAACIPSPDGATGCFRGVDDAPTCGGVCSSGQPLGGACSGRAGAQCATGWCSQGTCVAYTTAGQPCAAGTCAPNSFCDASGATPRCMPRVDLGQACSGDVCAPGLHCGLGTCRAAGAAGDACDAADHQGCVYLLGCYGGHCRAGEFLLGDVCDPSTNACTDTWCTRVADGGAVCLPSPGLGDPCSQYCASPYVCQAGVCARPGGLRAACPTSQCQLGLQCHNGCEAMPKVGEVCKLGVRCLGSYCDTVTNTCQPFVPTLGPCTDESQCWGGYDAHYCHAVDGGAGFCATCDLLY